MGRPLNLPARKLYTFEKVNDDFDDYFWWLQKRISFTTLLCCFVIIKSDHQNDDFDDHFWWLRKRISFTTLFTVQTGLMKFTYLQSSLETTKSMSKYNLQLSNYAACWNQHSIFPYEQLVAFHFFFCNLPLKS